MPTRRTLARLVKRIERSAALTERQVADRRRRDEQREITQRIADRPAACAAMDAAASYLARTVPLGADVRDYPEAVRLMGEVEAAVAGPATPI